MFGSPAVSCKTVAAECGQGVGSVCAELERDMASAMVSAMARVLVIVCVGLLVANVDSARTLKQSMKAETFSTADSLASQDLVTTYDAAPANTSGEYDYNKLENPPEDVFSNQGTLYSEEPPSDDTLVGTTDDAFANEGIFVHDQVYPTGDSHAYSSELPADSFAQGSDVTGDGHYPTLTVNPDGSSGIPDGSSSYVYDATSADQYASGLQFSDLDTNNYDPQPDVGGFAYEDTMPGN